MVFPQKNARLKAQISCNTKFRRRDQAKSTKLVAKHIVQKPFFKTGTLAWIGIRPKRRADMLAVDEVLADPARGLEGDRYAGSSGTRQVTLIQQEHLMVIASFLARDVSPSDLRRNLVVAGINLLALKNSEFRIGEVVLKSTGLCHPCSRMEEALGTGGYNAMRGHGGLTAQILQGGQLRIGDAVSGCFREPGKTRQQTLF